MTHILVVEDNPDDADLTVAALSRHPGVEIAVAEDGVDALDYLACAGRFAGRPPTLPDVVLLDLKLPRMNGFDVLRSMRSNPLTKHVPVVVLTSSLEQEDLLEAYGLGANSYVRKPVNFDEFQRVAERLGAYWLDLNEVPGVRRGAAR